MPVPITTDLAGYLDFWGGVAYAAAAAVVVFAAIGVTIICVLVRILAAVRGNT